MFVKSVIVVRQLARGCGGTLKSLKKIPGNLGVFCLEEEGLRVIIIGSCGIAGKKYSTPKLKDTHLSLSPQVQNTSFQPLGETDVLL